MKDTQGLSSPLGCDTFVAYPPFTSDGTVIFGKNSDRPSGEGQSITRYPATKWAKNQKLSCTYINIPQISKTNAVLLSQIDWMWGAEMGANDHGVVIGNEAVWTVEPIEDRALLGMDLVRLGLERGRSAREALDVITSLLEEHGQGGACAKHDPSFTYHNSFLIADFKEAWVLETAGRLWVAEKTTKGGRNISNGLTIRTNYDISSIGLQNHAQNRGLWDGKGKLDWAKCFSDGPADHSADSRQCCGTVLVEKYDKGGLNTKAMMNILSDHEGGICMHGGFETTASMVSELHSDRKACQHWLTGKPHPCKNPFILQHEMKSEPI